jgi:hypothetical protein
MAGGGHDCIWIETKKAIFIEDLSPLTPPGQMNQNLVGSILGRSFTKTAHLLPICFFIEDFPYMPSTKFQFIWESGFKEDFFRNQPIRKKKKSSLKSLSQIN